ncbi:MAG: hypothetical protein ACQESG_08500 [Nanobdellota archaeon]
MKVEDMKDQMEELKMKLQDMERQLNRRIKKNPLGAVGTAFGIGALIGGLAAFLRRK